MAGGAAAEGYPYYGWLESVMTGLAAENVKAISLEVVNEEGDDEEEEDGCC